MDEIAVIVVNYRTSHLMKHLLASLNEDYLKLRIIILDNESSDSSLNELKALEDSRVDLIESRWNRGFTGGINFAVEYLRGKYPKIQYFFLLNPDALSCRNLISGLFEMLKVNKDAASISPTILDMKGNIWYSGGRLDLSSGSVYPVAITREQNSGPREVDVFSGCAALFDIEKFLKVGMFNESLFMYYDEADLSIRLKKAGYKILHSPRWEIRHDVSYTTRNISHLKTYYMTRNKLITFGESMTNFNKLYFLVHEVAYHLKNRRFRNVIYHIRGLVDYRRKRLGQIVS